MSREEVNKLYKQASGLRKRVPAKQAPTRGKVSLDDIVLQLLVDDQPSKRFVKTVSGVVTWVGTQTLIVKTRTDSISALVDKQRAVVGDEVTLGYADSNQWMLHSVATRKTSLSRPDVGNANLERVIVANIDVVAIVVSVVSPPLHPRLIDRYLIAIQKGGAEPIICVNKIDLLTDRSELNVLDPYIRLQIPVFECSNVSGIGIEEVRTYLKGKTSAFVGHSGVGKSSLANGMYPQLGLETGEVSKGYGRGTHTTTASSLFEFEGGTRLIDTPGIRGFGLWKMKPEELKWYFPEFDEIRCKFNDCSHSHEPGCEVKWAAQRGDIHPARYETYIRLLNGDE